MGAPDEAFHAFLDRLMGAESGGHSHAKNPRSSALGPFQFINSTFLAVMRQHFPDDVARKNEGQILAMRTKHDVARRAAHAFSKDNMAYLVERGIKPTFGHLRLAFLLGPQGAARVLAAPPGRPVTNILEGGVIAANPFMRRMTAADLVARATRDVSPKQQPGRLPDAAPERPPLVVADAPPATPAAPAAAAQSESDNDQPTRVAEVADAAPAGQPDQSAPAPQAAAVSVDQAEAQSKSDDKSDDKAGAKPEAKRATIAAVHLGTVRRGDRISVINVKCDSRLASCQRWIDQQVAKLIKAGDRNES